MKITIHRGTQEIGGSCIELSAGDSRIVLDIGMPLVDSDGSDFDMKSYKDLDGPSLVDKGVLPDIAGLYEWQEPSVDAVLISHAHQDHYGFLYFVHPDIVVYMSDGTKRLIEITATFAPIEDPLKRTEIFSWHNSYEIGSFTMTPHLVDHSCASAYAFEIEAGGKRLFYSGDFRDHGHIKKAIDILYKKVAPEMDALLMEGTMLGRTEERVQTEEELSQSATEICKSTEGIVFIMQSGQNIPRSVSFFKAAVRSGRKFVLDVYTAHVLGELSKCDGGEKLPCPGKPGFDSVGVWYPNQLTGMLLNKGLQDVVYAYTKNHKVTKPEMLESPEEMMVYVRPGMEKDLKAMKGLEGSTLVYSLWDGYKEKKRTKEFLEFMESLGVNIVTLHTSGHAEYSALQKMVDNLKPKKLFPIHTFHPDQFQDFGADVHELEDGVGVEL